ncbi:unnamed protein product [Adineta ricciae]|uniref:Globin domain-containing protein n=1 Tax=Adineta ricciae TaxID=249248 RepID=A0A815V1W5_ADIRI|nr:unnamed protein product [Adineta ricciae]CAF1670329.1 unnamed protein product [Adineta ricciae]
MGCSNSKAADTLNSADGGIESLKENFLQRLLNTDTVKELSKNAFVSVLNKYPEAKKIFNVPETTKTNAELLGTREVQTASNNLLNHYIDIVKNANGDLNTAAQSKAEELKELGIKAGYIKTYGENLVRNSATSADNQLSASEETAWKTLTNEITNKLTTAMDNLPNS